MSFTVRAFTLIELLVVITIIMILSVGVYVPYHLYENISRVRTSGDTVAQAVSEARVSSVSGYLYGAGGSNANVGILISKDSTSLSLIAYPYDLPLDQITFTGSATARTVKTYPLEDGVSVRSLTGATASHDVIVLFRAPHGEMSLLVPSGTGATVVGSGSLSVRVAYREAVEGQLTRDISIR